MTLIESKGKVGLGVEIEPPDPRRFQLGAHTIEVVDYVDGELAITAWKLYEEQFQALDGNALQRHLMRQAEFINVCGDSAVEKWLVFDSAGTLCGLATYTNNLPAMPLISPRYFQRRWPFQFEEQTIWYCGFVTVTSPDRTVFPALIGLMYDQAAADEGVIALDYCNERARLAQVVDRLLAARARARDVGLDDVEEPGAGYRGYEADSQHYWVYETAETARAVA